MSGKVGTYTLVMSFIRKASIDVVYLGINMSHLTFSFFRFRAYVPMCGMRVQVPVLSIAKKLPCRYCIMMLL